MLEFKALIKCANCNKTNNATISRKNYPDAISDMTQALEAQTWKWRLQGWECLGEPEYNYLCPTCAESKLHAQIKGEQSC